jgi:hypothetical protein
VAGCGKKGERLKDPRRLFASSHADKSVECIEMGFEKLLEISKSSDEDEAEMREAVNGRKSNRDLNGEVL